MSLSPKICITGHPAPSHGSDSDTYVPRGPDDKGVSSTMEEVMKNHDDPDDTWAVLGFDDLAEDSGPSGELLQLAVVSG